MKILLADDEMDIRMLLEMTLLDAGHEVVTATFPFSASGRAMSLDSTSGFVKAIGDAKNSALLGIVATALAVAQSNLALANALDRAVWAEASLRSGGVEEAADVARMLEETGCELQALTPIGEFFVSPGMSVERISLYCGRIDASQADGVHGLEHEGEELRVVKLSREAAMAALFGRLNSTSVIMAMQWLALHRDALLAEWGSPELAGP